MKNLTLFLLFSSLVLAGYSQTRIDSSFSFQTNPTKKYSLYIPATYSPATPHRVMLALHPFNVSRWDAKSWCDTLVDFAAMNNLILACPDGDADGKIDDPIDTAFTSTLLDSMAVWYNIDSEKIYCMGFSWGGQTTYTYGLNHACRFGGFLPIGSALGGTAAINSVLPNASGKPYYIVHGSADSPSSRFYPIRDSLTANGAIVNTNFLSGVGHTIDFPNRNQILSVAYVWIDSVNCATPAPVTIRESIAPVRLVKLAKNSTTKSNGLTLELDEQINVLTYSILTLDGKLATSGIVRNGNPRIDLPGSMAPGYFVLRVSHHLGEERYKFQIAQ